MMLFDNDYYRCLDLSLHDFKTTLNLINHGFILSSKYHAEHYLDALNNVVVPANMFQEIDSILRTFKYNQF